MNTEQLTNSSQVGAISRLGTQAARDYVAQMDPERLWSNGYDSLIEQFPNCEGALLDDVFEVAFVINACTSLEYLDNEGNPLVYRHPLNDKVRAQAGVSLSCLVGLVELMRMCL